MSGSKGGWPGVAGTCKVEWVYVLVTSPRGEDIKAHFSQLNKQKHYDITKILGGDDLVPEETRILRMRLIFRVAGWWIGSTCSVICGDL